MLLIVKDIWVHYGRAEAIKGLSMEVAEQEVITIIGANGAGKSTLLRTVSGLKLPTSGEIWFQNGRIDGLTPREITALGIGHVMENRRLFPQMTVMENLRLGAFLTKSREEIQHNMEEVFSRFPFLRQRETQLAGTLSGGEQQMAAIGQSLMAKPMLLLMDEPSVGLSPLLVKEVARIVSDINKAGVTVVLVEQNAKMALKLANRGYVLETGQVVMADEAQNLLNSDYVQKAYLGG